MAPPPKKPPPKKPVANGAAPKPKGPTPTAKRAAPAAKGATPIAKGATPVAKGATPVAKPKGVPAAKGAAPVAKVAAPVAKRATPTVKFATPVVKGPAMAARGSRSEKRGSTTVRKPSPPKVSFGKIIGPRPTPSSATMGSDSASEQSEAATLQEPERAQLTSSKAAIQKLEPIPSNTDSALSLSKSTAAEVERESKRSSKVAASKVKPLLSPTGSADVNAPSKPATIPSAERLSSPNLQLKRGRSTSKVAVTTELAEGESSPKVPLKLKPPPSPTGSAGVSAQSKPTTIQSAGRLYTPNLQLQRGRSTSKVIITTDLPDRESSLKVPLKPKPLPSPTGSAGVSAQSKPATMQPAERLSSPNLQQKRARSTSKVSITAELPEREPSPKVQSKPARSSVSKTPTKPEVPAEAPSGTGLVKKTRRSIQKPEQEIAVSVDAINFNPVRNREISLGSEASKLPGVSKDSRNSEDSRTWTRHTKKKGADKVPDRRI